MLKYTVKEVKLLFYLISTMQVQKILVMEDELTIDYLSLRKYVFNKNISKDEMILTFKALDLEYLTFNNERIYLELSNDYTTFDDYIQVYLLEIKHMQKYELMLYLKYLQFKDLGWVKCSIEYVRKYFNVPDTMQNKDLLVKIRNAIKRLDIPIEIELERYNKKIVKIIFLFGKNKTLSKVAAELT
jgi:hypothetical protein